MAFRVPAPCGFRRSWMSMGLPARRCSPTLPWAGSTRKTHPTPGHQPRESVPQRPTVHVGLLRDRAEVHAIKLAGPGAILSTSCLWLVDDAISDWTREVELTSSFFMAYDGFGAIRVPSDAQGRSHHQPWRRSRR